jgi:division protein CdvB (Snf7/Vps24/ESCRT-III family)
MTERTDVKLARLKAEGEAMDVKRKQNREQATRIQNKQKSTLATAARKLQTRRKILLGAYLMGRMENEPDLKDRVLGDLGGYLKKPHERQAFDLPPLEIVK